MNEKWLEIVWFSNYLMNPDTLVIRNVLKDRILKVNGRKQVALINHDGQYSITIPRLLFSVINGISPKKVPVNFFIVIEENKPAVYNMSEYLYKKKMECRKRRVEDIDPLQIYREERDFIDKIIVSLETENMDFVFSEIYKHNDGIVSYLLNSSLVCNKDAAHEIASCALETTIEHIISGKVVFKPFEYIKNVARFLAMRVRSDKKKQRAFFDNVAI